MDSKLAKKMTHWYGLWVKPINMKVFVWIKVKASSLEEALEKLFPTTGEAIAVLEQINWKIVPDYPKTENSPNTMDIRDFSKLKIISISPTFRGFQP